MLFASGLELSSQLAELRKMYMKQYKVDPITGFQPEFRISCDVQPSSLSGPINCVAEYTGSKWPLLPS